MNQTDQPIVAILIDDDESHLELLELSLTSPQVRQHVNIAERVLTFTDPIDALTHMPAQGPAVIFCDYRMPGATGLDWLPDFVNLRIGPVFVLTARGDEQIAAASFKLGANDYLIKSRVFDDPDYVAHAVNDAMRRFELEMRNRELTSELRRFNRELERKNARLSELTDTAHRFVDNVAHEFRTPLVTNERQKGHVYLRCTKKRGPCNQRRYIREEDMSEQVAQALLSVSLPEEDADWMVERLRNRQGHEQKAAEQAVAKIREDLDHVDRQTERLQEAYLDEVVSLEEFRTSKTQLVAKRQSLKENLAHVVDDGANRLEPTSSEWPSGF
jgi:CheY-like chemotaxis protein